MNLSQQPATAPATTCGSCGGSVAAESRFCTYCGTSQVAPGASGTYSSPPANPPPLAAPTPTDLLGSYLAAISFPFRRPDWLQKLWWLPLAFFLPAINLILLRGWRLDIVRRLGRRSPDPLPELNDLGRIFGDGLLLWTMTAIYFIPQAILLVLFGSGALESALTLGGWLLAQLSGDTSTSLVSVLVEIGFGALLNLAIPALYPLLTYPLYRIGMVRYATTGRIGAFFDLAANFDLARRHFSAVMSLFLLEYLTTTLVFTLSGVAASTVIGALLVPIILLPALYWTTGHLFGTFALRINGGTL